MIRVLLADRHRSFAEALGLRLDAEPGLQVVAVAVSPEEAVHAVRVRPVDVAVLAVDGEFVAVGSQALLLRPDLKLVGVSSGDDVSLLTRAIRQGFRGWVSKDVGIAELLDVLQAVLRGETRIPPALLTGALQLLMEQQEEQALAELPFRHLTRREREVLDIMCRGATRSEIAEMLEISPHTVRTHLQRILTKLDVHTSLEAVTLARRAGIR